MKQIAVPEKKKMGRRGSVMCMSFLSCFNVSLVEQLDGKSADWMEKVSDEQYRTEKRAD